MLPPVDPYLGGMSFSRPFLKLRMCLSRLKLPTCMLTGGFKFRLDRRKLKSMIGRRVDPQQQSFPPSPDISFSKGSFSQPSVPLAFYSAPLEQLSLGRGQWLERAYGMPGTLGYQWKKIQLPRTSTKLKPRLHSAHT